MQWVDELDMSGSDSIFNEDLGAKSGGEESIVKRDASQFDAHGLELDHQPIS